MNQEADSLGMGIPSGLSNLDKKHWPGVTEAEEELEPILLLKPKSERHGKVLSYLKKRIKHSERKMGQFYDRWTANELRVQATVDPDEYDRIIKRLTERGDAGKQQVAGELKLTITVPYLFSTLSTIVTYLVHTFAGRKPMFPLSSYNSNLQGAVPIMESVLQYQADHMRFIKELYNFMWDGQIYGVAVMRNDWTVKMRNRTVWISGVGEGMERTKELRTVYEGNMTKSVDPFNFFPDPNVPMCEVNRRGEYVFWRTFEGKHAIKSAEADGLLHWVDYAGSAPLRNENHRGDSVRNVRAAGDSLNADNNKEVGGVDQYQVDQGTAWIIPAELGLSNRTWPEKWIFTILNGSQIVQAEPFDADHEMHPVVVSEPLGLGYGFGHMANADYLAALQDIMSWLINSHAVNVREVLNNSFVVDPHRVEMQDMANKKPGEARVIRLKKAAAGTDVRSAIQQLAVGDVTQGHLNEIQGLQRLGDTIAGVNDNMRGIEMSGARKSATETRISAEAGASRLASMAKLISAQALVDLQEQWVLNTQQYMTENAYINIVGERTLLESQLVTPQMLVGDFHYPVHDGTLPVDKAAMAEAFGGLMQMIMADPELRPNYNIVRMINHLAELAGAKGLDNFQINIQPQQPGMDPTMDPSMGGMPPTDPAAMMAQGGPEMPAGNPMPSIPGDAGGMNPLEGAIGAL